MRKLAAIAGIWLMLFGAGIMLFGAGRCRFKEDDSQIEALRKQLEQVQAKEAQLREFVVRHASPLRMQNARSAEDARWFLEWRVNPETLAWERFNPYFGVDRSKLRGGTGTTGDVSDP